MQRSTRRIGRMVTALFVTCMMALTFVPALAMADSAQPSGDDSALTGLVSADESAAATDGGNNTEDYATDASLQSSTDHNESGAGIEAALDVETSESEDVASEMAATSDADQATDANEQVTIEAAAEEAVTEPVHVQYRVHVQSYGWQDYVQDGAEMGTTGQSKRLEGINAKLDFGKTGLSGGIRYRVHAQRYGWMPWVADDALGGTTGESLRLEAIQMELYGDVAAKYNIYYSVHAQGRGWMGWATNGASAGTAGMSKRLESIKIVLVAKDGGSAPSSDFVQYDAPFDGGSVLAISSHVQRLGWLGETGNGGTTGTTGQSLRMEAFKVSAPGLDVPGTVLVDGHVQGIGWTGYAQNMAGTTGQSRRLEAVKIALTDEAAERYDIYYRTHVAHLGWLAWASNGAEAGTSGMSNRVEAIQVLLVRKGEPGPDSSGSAHPESFVTGTNVFYNGYCQTYAWRGEVANGGVAGTVGESKRLEAITMRLDGGNIGGDISYRVYVAGIGWQDYKTNNAMAGTTGESRGIEGVQVVLSGRAASMYNVYYTTHVANAGWLGWACNGQEAGAPGTGHSVQAVKVVLVPKGAGAPGSTENRTVGRDFFDDPMVRAAQGYYSPTGWLIMVDDARTLLGVFRGSQGHWSKVDMWRVSTGAPATPSVHGVFSVGSRGYVFGHGYSCYYWTEWNGPYLFHSIKYNEGTFDVQDGTIGAHVSMGCVRMPIDKAKWIYDTIPSGSTVVVY